MGLSCCMKPLLSAPQLTCLLFAIANIPCSAFVSIGIVSEERAAELGLNVRSEKTSSGALRITVEFKTEGELKIFSEATRGNRVELQVGDFENPETVAALREDRSTPGRLIVHLSTDRTQIDKTSIWIIRPAAGIADVIRLKDFVDVGQVQEKVGKTKVNRSAKPAEQDGSDQPASASESKPEGSQKPQPESRPASR